MLHQEGDFGIPHRSRQEGWGYTERRCAEHCHQFTPPSLAEAVSMLVSQAVVAAGAVPMYRLGSFVC